MNVYLKSCVLAAGILSATAGHAISIAQGSMPSQQGLMAAKQSCMGMSMQIKSLIAMTQAPGPQVGGQFEVEELSEEVLENDTAAVFALQAMGNSTFALGQALDAAVANYYTPNFASYHAEVCNLARRLGNENMGAKTAAAMPSVGRITPYQFNGIEAEIANVRAQAQCY